MINIISNEDDFIMPLYFQKSIIIIYGANEIGKQIYRGSEINPYFCGVVPYVNFFVDSKASSIKNIQDIRVITFARLKKYLESWDNKLEINIIIATKDIEKSNSIQNKLMKQLREYKDKIINIFFMKDYDSEVDKYGLNKLKRTRINPFILEGYEDIEECKADPYKYLNEVNLDPDYVMLAFNEFKYPDIKTKYWNSEKGLRKTIYAKETYKNNIYFLGYSRVRGWGSEDKHTIPSQLQYWIDKTDREYRVLNYSQPHNKNVILSTNIVTLFMKLKDIDLKENDIVILPATHGPDKVYDTEYNLKLIATLKKIKEYCDNYKVKLYFIFWQRIFDKPNLTDKELTMYNYVKVSIKENPITHEMSRYLNQLAAKSKEMIQSMCLINEINYIDLSSMFIDPAMDNKIFIDEAHYTPKANQRIAELIFETIFNNNLINQFSNDVNHWIQLQIDKQIETVLSDQLCGEVDKYIEGIKKITKLYDTQSCTVGCIVVNCNPFTLGHKYLIETAAKNVDLLYIFVVEENKSVYSFEERFALVAENCKDMNNVIVVPSGKFIISKMTFPEYFEKETIQKGDTMSGPDVDLGIFCWKIAPGLNITKRFVGEEPSCVVTNNYNIEMKKKLPRYGIEVIEIPRKIMGTDVISASKVRKCIIEESYDILERLVPEITFEFLMAKHSKKV